MPASFVFTSFETPGRASVRPLTLVNVAQNQGRSARAILDPVEALSVARRNAEGSSVVVVTGSAFVVGHLRHWWLTNVVERSRPLTPLAAHFAFATATLVSGCSHVRHGHRQRDARLILRRRAPETASNTAMAGGGAVVLHLARLVASLLGRSAVPGTTPGP